MVLNFKTLQQLSQNLSILYVEDDTILRDQTVVIFKNLFKHVDVAVDGKEGLEMYHNYYTNYAKYYDVIISDIQMPNLDGIGLSKEIFAINKLQKIIIVSAYNDKKYLIDLINIGVNGFMQKPLSTDNMLHTLYDTCQGLSEKNLIKLDDIYSYNLTISVLFQGEERVDLSDYESKLLHLLISNKNQSFSAIEIFNHLYIDEPEKDFSSDSIKSLIKRLRKKTPTEFILNRQHIGYSANF